MEQEDQQEAVASLTVAGKEKKKVSFMIRTHYQSVFLVNSTFSVGQRMLVVLNMKKDHFFKKHQAM